MSTLDPMMPALRRSEYAQRVRACAQAQRLHVMAGDDSVRQPSLAQRLGDFLIAAGTRLKAGPQGVHVSASSRQ